MEAAEFKKEIVAQAQIYGMCTDDNKKNVVIRENLKDLDKGNNVPFFGFILPDQPTSGAYKDLSLVFFPTPVTNVYVMSLVVGSQGYNQDGYMAMRPGTRRQFLSILPTDPRFASFSKVDFTDIENPVTFDERITDTGVDLDKYNKDHKVILIGCLVNSDTDRDLINAWVAQYADLRNWPRNEAQKTAMKNAISGAKKGTVHSDIKKEVIDLLHYKQFVVLQGAPGTGKTYLAEEIGKDKNEFNKTFLIQFHAETSYSQFIEGIRPDLASETLRYKKEEGKLLEAIRYALDHKDENVLLIIDEINRANLANVLGPVFYLFEKRSSDRDNGLEIAGLTLKCIPENLYVIATMNTADRSIAVVDFALRRRFAWYTVYPHSFESSCKAGKKLFDNIARIFEKYATDEEMNLQPGGSYFNAADEKELNFKIEYDLMPLIKEYLDEGLLSAAKSEFSDLFYNLTQKQLYR